MAWKLGLRRPSDAFGRGGNNALDGAKGGAGPEYRGARGVEYPREGEK